VSDCDAGLHGVIDDRVRRGAGVRELIKGHSQEVTYALVLERTLAKLFQDRIDLAEKA
jgi:hypothetical protein